MTAPAVTGSPSLISSLVRMTLEPFSAMRMLLVGMPRLAAVKACFFNCLYSPCTGRKYLGLVRVSISFCSSWQAWPETCTSYMLS